MTVVGTYYNYYNAVFSLTVANCNITSNKYYGFAVYPEIGGGGGDLNFTFTQVAPATTWTITHNLGKFPSVSVVDTADTQVYGDVEYIDDNSLRVTFSAAFGGKAYLN